MIFSGLTLPSISEFVGKVLVPRDGGTGPSPGLGPSPKCRCCSVRRMPCRVQRDAGCTQGARPAGRAYTAGLSCMARVYTAGWPSRRVLPLVATSAWTPAPTGLKARRLNGGPSFLRSPAVRLDDPPFAGLVGLLNGGHHAERLGPRAPCSSAASGASAAVHLGRRVRPGGRTGAGAVSVPRSGSRLRL